VVSTNADINICTPNVEQIKNERKYCRKGKNKNQFLKENLPYDNRKLGRTR
jgi:hypothetical protein